MFERYTEEARQVVVSAQENAKTLRHNYIGTAHLLLGLFPREEAPGKTGARKALEDLGITFVRAQAQTRRIMGSGEETLPGQLPFTPRVRKVLELAFREALARRQSYVRPEHILLGLIHDGEGTAIKVLTDLGVDLEEVKQGVLRQLAARASEESLKVVSLKLTEKFRRSYGQWFIDHLMLFPSSTTHDHPAVNLHDQLESSTKLTRGVAESYLDWIEAIERSFTQLPRRHPAKAMALKIAQALSKME